MENNTALAVREPRQQEAVSPFYSIEAFNQAKEMLGCICSSDMVPKQYRGTQGIGNAMMALELSRRIGAPLLQVMQNMQPIHGRPAWSATFLISGIEASGLFSPLRYEEEDLGVREIAYSYWTGPEGNRRKVDSSIKVEDRRCVAYATELATGNVLRSAPITVEMAVKENWYTRSDSKWPTMTHQMLRYRAAAFFQRAYCPGITMGLLTREEVEDMGPIVDVQTSTVRIADGISVPARVTAAPVETVVEPTPAAPAATPPAEEPKRTRKRSTELPLGDLTPHQRALEGSLKENELTVSEMSQAYNELFAEGEPRERATAADFEPAEISKIMQNMKGLTEIIRTARGTV